MNNEYGRKYGGFRSHLEGVESLKFIQTSKGRVVGCLGSRMTLALILFICLLGSAPMSAAVSSSTIQPAAQQESPPNPSDSSAPRTVKTSGPQGQNSSSPKPAAAT